MQQAPANWIKQVLSNNDVLLPWSELYTERAKLMIHSLVDCLLFMLDMLPASESVLGNLFFWYEIQFAKIGVPRHILKPIHAAMILMPWHLFQPQPVHIDCIYRCLQQVSGLSANKSRIRYNCNAYFFVSVPPRVPYVHRTRFPSDFLGTLVKTKFTAMGLHSS